jgi:hypothetical protein
MDERTASAACKSYEASPDPDFSFRREILIARATLLCYFSLPYKDHIKLGRTARELFVRIRAAFAIGIALLLCSLASMELPELIKLVDDTSNDYSLVLSGKNAPTAVRAEVRMLPRGTVASATSQYPSDEGSVRPDLRVVHLFRTSDGMLRMLCTNRT